MGLSLRGTTSGAIDINPPAVAGDNTITLPGNNGSANQFFKNSGTAGIVTYSSLQENPSGDVSIAGVTTISGYVDATSYINTTGGLFSTGLIQGRRTDSADEVFRGQDSSSTRTSFILGNGNASFVGKVEVGPSAGIACTISAAGAITAEGNVTVGSGAAGGAGSKLWSTGFIELRNDTASINVIRLFSGGYGDVYETFGVSRTGSVTANSIIKSVSDSGFYAKAASSGQQFSFRAADTSSNNNAVIYADGSGYFLSNIGIGTDNPTQQKLTIDVNSSGTTAASYDGINICNTSSTTNNGSAIIFGQAIAGNSYARIGVINSDRSGGSEDQDIFFGTLGGGSYAERLRITSVGLLDVSGGIHVTENVTPTSGRGVEIFEAGTGVGQIQSFNRTGNGWDQLNIKGSEVKIYTGTTNGLGLNLAASQSTLYGTSDGIFNLDTTDGRGSFMRFKENGTTKAWVGSAEGMGGGLSGDQDDLGLRAADNIMFSANGAERARITSDGLTFNGDTAAANALDDYEEGTWTPSLTFAGSNSGMTHTIQEGNYTKIGRQVIAQFRLQISAKGSSTGSMNINTPLAVLNTFSQTGIDGNVLVSYSSGMDATLVGSAPVSGYCEGGTSITYYTARLSSGDAATLNQTDLDDDFSISGTMFFYAA